MRPVLLAMLVLLAGCAASARRQPAPETLVVAFADGFHSGVLIPREDLPLHLRPAGPQAPWAVLHFGEQRWIAGEADSLGDALALAAMGGEGGVQLDLVDWWVHRRGGTDPAALRLWAFPVARTDQAGLLARLEDWIDPEQDPRPIRPGSSWRPSRRAWTLERNCHDFTIDLLRGAGIELGWRPVWQAWQVRAALDQAWASTQGP